MVRIPFARGNRVSVMAALSTEGFIGWKCTEGTFTRNTFYDAFCEKVIPHLNPWPLPRSIVILDNAKIHMFKELENAIYQCGARIIYLPPYCPELNPIEVCFGRLKAWIQKHANLAFPLYPEMVLDVGMYKCTREDHGAVDIFGHCGYDRDDLRRSVFDGLAVLKEYDDDDALL